MKTYPNKRYLVDPKSSANFKTKKLWLRDVRRRWVQFRRYWNNRNDSPWYGCSYYPPEVRNLLYHITNKLKEADKLMREYYKDA